MAIVRIRINLQIWIAKCLDGGDETLENGQKKIEISKGKKIKFE
jgi:hypothetical protein